MISAAVSMSIIFLLSLTTLVIKAEKLDAAQLLLAKIEFDYLDLIIPRLFFIDGAFDISIVQHPSRFPLAYPENHSDVF